MNTDPQRADELPSRHIARDLRGAIAAGTMTPGTKLPSERTLATQYGTARNTAREAIRLLAQEGLVTAEHGRGVFVREPGRLYRFGSERYSRKNRETGLTPFRLETQRQGKTPRIDVAGIERVRPPADVAQRLEIDPDRPTAVRRENRYYADDEPVQLVTTYLRWAEAKSTRLMEPNSGANGIYGRLEELGHVMTRIREEIVARMPTPEETAFLQLLPGVPVLDVLHTSLDQAGVPFEVTRYVHRGDLTGLLYELDVEQ